MKIERIHITIFLGTAALFWWGTLLWQETPVTWEHGKPFTVVVSFLGLLGFVFNRYLWHLSIFHGWFVKRPDLRGTWYVELLSSYETGKPVPLIICYMGIEQTLLDLKMHLMTSESESRSIASHVRPSSSGYQVICVYQNEPDIHLRNKRISEIHNGALIIDTHGSRIRPDTLKAKYWTDRKTMGTMNFKSRVSQVFTRFEDAKQHFGQI